MLAKKTKQACPCKVAVYTAFIIFLRPAVQDIKQILFLPHVKYIMKVFIKLSIEDANCGLINRPVHTHIAYWPFFFCAIPAAKKN